MSTSAVAPCMAPLLLHPLLAGECEIETDFNVGGDGYELSGSGIEEATDDDGDDDQDGATLESDAYTDDDLDNASSRSCSEFGGKKLRG
ncbi:hypothetical protein KPL70_010740 [Citrus sinensis]|nr:hypothetical protein KPL70_010740 [Citrus sinensis]